MEQTLSPVEAKPGREFSRTRFGLSRGLATMVAAILILIGLGIALAPSSLSAGAVAGMLPFAAVLAIVGLGQMVVIQQSGIDLSVPGAVSLTVVLVTHIPDGDDSKLPGAIGLVVIVAIATGLANAFLVGGLGLSPIIATLGMNALLFGAIIGISGGVPRTTTNLLAAAAGGTTAGIPHSVIIAAVTLVIVVIFMKRTIPGRRFEAVGASVPTTRAVGIHTRRYIGAGYVGAQLLYAIAGVTLAGVVTQPSAYLGNNYLLPTVAVVVLGGTSLLGGRGFPVATVAAALFLTQLNQFTLAIGVPSAYQRLIQAIAFAVGVAIYTVNWGALRRRFRAMNSAENPGKQIPVTEMATTITQQKEKK